MRVIILGASRFGTAIASQLMTSGNEVVLIDKDRARLEKLSETVDCGMVEGDGTMPSVLRDAHRDENDIFIAVTNASDDNILASVVARSVGFGRVIPQITDAEFMDVCEELELSEAINPHATVAESICASLEDDTEVETDIGLHSELAMKRVTVPEAMAGQSLGALDLPDGCRAVALIRGDAETFAVSETTLQAQDHLLFAVSRDQVDALVGMFDG